MADGLDLASLPDTGTTAPGSQQAEIIAACVVTQSLALIALVLRFLAKKRVKANLWLDDATAAIAFIFSLGEMGLIIGALHTGLGTHLTKQNVVQLPTFLKGLFASQMLYRASLTFAKYSMILMYWRIFSKKDYVRRGSIALAVLVTLWAIAVLIATVFQCVPVHKFWDRNAPGVCNVDGYAFFAGTSVTNTATDVVLLIFPLPAIWRLNTSRSQKIGLTVTFMLGGFVCIMSIVRLAVVRPSDMGVHDLTWTYTSVAMWSQIETNAAIVCACLASLRPLLVFFTTGFVRRNKWSSLESSKYDHGQPTMTRRRMGSSPGSDDRLYPGILDINTTSGDIEFGTRTIIESGREEALMLGEGIQVKREVVVT